MTQLYTTSRRPANGKCRTPADEPTATIDRTHFARLRGLVEHGWLGKLTRVEMATWLAYESHANFDTGESWPSPARLARQLGIPAKSIRRARASLIQYGLIEVINSGGGSKSAKLRMLLPTSVAGLPHSWGIPSEEATPTPPLRHDLPQNETAPNKEEQITEQPNEQTSNGSRITLPLNLQTDAFQAAWARWVRHRREIRKKLTPTSVSQQLKLLEGFGEVRAIAAIDHTITMGWTGLREENSNGNNHKTVSATRPGDYPSENRPAKQFGV